MQHLVILPGNSKENQTWGEVMRDVYGPRFGSVHLQTYEHWETGGPVIDFDMERTKLRERPAPLFTESEVIVMAKSAGSLLALLAVQGGQLAPKGCVFFGMPFDMAATKLFADDWSPIADFTLPAIAFHNRADPTTDYRFTAATLAQYAPHIELITTSEEDHWYGDTDTYTPHIDTFLKSLNSWLIHKHSRTKNLSIKRKVFSNHVFS